MKSIGLVLVGFAFCCASIHGETATVKLLTHNLESLGSVTDIAGGALSITGEGGKHWAIVVQFQGDDLVYVCELHRDPTRETSKGSGGIVGGCNRLTKAEAVKGKNGVHVYNFGEATTTPDQLIEMGNSISFNGQDYHLFLRNCQHWAKELLQKLGMSTTWFNIKKFLQKTTGPGWIMARFEKNSL